MNTAGGGSFMHARRRGSVQHARLQGRDNVNHLGRAIRKRRRGVRVCRDRRAAKTQVFGGFQWPQEGVGQPLAPHALGVSCGKAQLFFTSLILITKMNAFAKRASGRSPSVLETS